MQELYETLYRDTETDRFGKLSHFVAVKGKRYQPGGLMLVGRCVNGWPAIEETDAETFGRRAAALLTAPDKAGPGFTCIQGEHGRYCFGDMERPDGRWWLSRSAFWRTARQIWAAVGQRAADEDRWFEQIVWSNLFKLAPAEGGNPGGRLIRLQLRSCVDLLLREIELFQPGLLLFVTGAWWLDPKEYGRPTFAEALELTLPASEGRPEHVVATGEYRGAKVIVCNRPEGRSESGFVQAVLACC